MVLPPHFHRSLNLLAAWLLPLGDAAGSVVVVPLQRRSAAGEGQQRRLTQVDEAQLFGDLYHYMSYHADVLVGTPGQLQSVIVDTGSSITAFPCQNCGGNCGTHMHPPFSPAESATFRWVNCSEAGCNQCQAGRCRYSLGYVEGSRIEGQFFEDILHVGHAKRGNRKAPVWMGCHTLETGLFLSQRPSGIMGAREDNWDVLTALVGGSIERRVLGLCLADHGGVMSIGGVNHSWTPAHGPLQSVDYGPNYAVAVAGASLVPVGGGQAADLGFLAGTYTLDSGTTFTYFSADQAESLRSALKTACAGGGCGNATQASMYCWWATDTDINLFPNLTLRLGEATYVWTPRGYMASQHPDQWCYTFRGEPPLTLGAAFMRHHLLVFDTDRKRVSFAPSDCPPAHTSGGTAQLPQDVASTTGTTPQAQLSSVQASSAAPNAGPVLATFLMLVALVRAT